MWYFFFFQAEDGIRDFCLSRGLGDVYKRQGYGAYVPLSNLYSSPVVTDVTVMVAVGTAHVGSVALAVTLGAPGAAATVTSVDASQPAAFFTHTLCKPLLITIRPPPKSTQDRSSTASDVYKRQDVTVMV